MDWLHLKARYRVPNTSSKPTTYWPFLETAQPQLPDPPGVAGIAIIPPCELGANKHQATMNNPQETDCTARVMSELRVSV